MKKQLEEHVEWVDAQLDHIEQHSRLASVRVTGIEEQEGEDLNRVAPTDRRLEYPIYESQQYQSNAPRSASKPVDNINHARQINIQFKDYNSKATFFKGRDSSRDEHPNVYIAEDLTKQDPCYYI